MKFSKRLIDQLPIVVLTAIGIIFTISFYGKALVNSNNSLFSDSGDGLKNYYVYAYHIKHDSTYTNFEGMNYPYGENYLYTDCHPILANTLKFISTGVPSLESYSIGILNLCLIFSILFTFIILYLLLVELDFNKWISVFFSISITLLAPQIFRLGGHMSLSYSMAIPLSWLITLKIIQKPHMSYFALLFLSNMFWMLIHAYLGIIAISFSFTIFLLHIFTDKHKNNYLANYFWQAIVIILPILIFYTYAKLTDTHTGRTNNPSGFFLYNAEFDDVLIPHGKPFRPILDNISNDIIKLEWEARGYVGFFNSLLFLVLFAFAISSFFNTKAKVLLKSVFNNRRLNISLIAAFIILLFAMGVPFKQFPKLIELVPIVKQFRATGRFVWPFYFAFTVFAACVFQVKLGTNTPDKKKQAFSILFLILLLGISYIEGIQYHIEVSKSITKKPNVFNKSLLPTYLIEPVNQINTGKYQAIISIPFYHQGSESFYRPTNEKAVHNSLIFSYHTGMPNVCAKLVRTSIEESKRIVQLVTPNFYPKKLIHDLPGEKPFLILKTGENVTEYEQNILDKGKIVYKNCEVEFLELRAEDLFSDDRYKYLGDYYEKLPKLVKQESFYVTSPSTVLYYNGFENLKSDTSFRGSGSFKSIKKGKNTFARFPPNTFLKGKEYDFNMWMYNGEPDALNLWFRVMIVEYDESNNQWYSTTFFPDHAEVINNNWSLVEGIFTVKDPANWVYAVSVGKENSKASLHADDLLVKERGIDVYQMDSIDKSLFYNNHRISIP